jgi:hypothetical protein
MRCNWRWYVGLAPEKKPFPFFSSFLHIDMTERWSAIAKQTSGANVWNKKNSGSGGEKSFYANERAKKAQVQKLIISPL